MYRRIVLILLVLLAAVLPACSPSLNWREVRPEGGELKALLPCKPDEARRRQSLAGQEIEVRMLGCEAAGALFAVSVAELGAENRAMAVQVQWQAHLLGNMRASASATHRADIRGAGEQLPPVLLLANGQGAEGRPVTVQAVWFARGTRLYHAAVYAPRISAEMSEPFLSGLELP